MMRTWCSLLLCFCLGSLVSGCVDQSDPSWWEGKNDVNIIIDESGITERLSGQNCVECEASTCQDWKNPPKNSLRMHFIDVGQGDAIWIQSPTGENVLIDAGDGGFFGRTDGGDLVVDYLDHNGLLIGSTIDTVVISHAHSDHYGGVKTVLHSYLTLAFIDPGVDSDSQTYQGLLSSILEQLTWADIFRPALPPDDQSNTNNIGSAKGDEIDFLGPEVTTYLLSADSQKRLGSGEGTQINNTSVILKLSYAGRRVLLMGDAEEELEDDLISRFGANTAEPNLQAEILKVGHHGSSTSSTSHFLEKVWEGLPESDRRAVILSGRRDFSGTTLPTEPTVQRLQSMIGPEHLFSTEAGDALKEEKQAEGDDHILAVIREDGSFFVCYTD